MARNVEVDPPIGATMRAIVSLLQEIRDRLPQQQPQQPSQQDVLDRAVRRYGLGEPQPVAFSWGDKGQFFAYAPPPKPAGSAKIVNGLPDAVATPGAFNPGVTQENIAQTIGTLGWTATIRPPVSYTDPLKINKMAEYGLTGDSSEYELDHLVPLCCGGHPTDERNLWPQPRVGLLGARTKDLTEVAAQKAIVAGKLDLDVARHGFASDWIALHADLFANAGMREMLATIERPEDEP